MKFVVVFLLIFMCVHGLESANKPTSSIYSSRNIFQRWPKDGCKRCTCFDEPLCFVTLPPPSSSAFSKDHLGVVHVLHGGGKREEQLKETLMNQRSENQKIGCIAFGIANLLVEPQRIAAFTFSYNFFGRVIPKIPILYTALVQSKVFTAASAKCLSFQTTFFWMVFYGVLRYLSRKLLILNYYVLLPSVWFYNFALLKQTIENGVLQEDFNDTMNGIGDLFYVERRPG